VPLDRELTLKTAEKLLRQGKLDAAIAEYQKVIDDQPRDWNTANTLGDLLLRAGKTDKAVAQYTRIADHLAKEGFLPKANALYKKIIKIKPDEEPALMSAADISAQQGLVADAKMYYATVAERRKARGDRRGAAEVQVKIGALDPEDFDGRVLGARASAELGQTLVAAAELRAVAQELGEKGEQARSLEILQEASTLNPADPDARRMLVQSYIANGQFERVRELASTPAELKALAGELRERNQHETALQLMSDALQLDPSDDETRFEVIRAYVTAEAFDRALAAAPDVPWLRRLAAELMRRGHQDRALDVLAEASRQDPSDEDLKTDLARAFVRRGDLARAASYLTREAAGQDPALLLAYAEMELKGSNSDAALHAIREALQHDPSRRNDVVQLAWRVSELSADLAFECVELVATHAVEARDWDAAATALQEFVARVSNHVPALMKLVEVCVDGGLESAMHAAQAHLADAYLAAGLGSEARVIAEELVAREPWERTNLDRFRRALSLLGEPDPDAVIAERLGGQSPFMSTDMSRPSTDEDFEIPAVAPPGQKTRAPQAAGPLAAGPSAAAKPGVAAPASNAQATAKPSSAPRGAQPDGRTFELSPVAIDWTAILGDGSEAKPSPKPPAAPPPSAAQLAPAAHAGRGSDDVEVDLSEDLLGLKVAVPGPAGGVMEQKPKGPGDLEGVFQEFRDEVSKQTALDAAEQQFKLAHTYREMGMIDEAIAEFQKAARSPKRRFEAASIVARLYKERGKVPQAIEWFERAAEAPAPTADAGRSLLYDLAATLEANNESARALAVFMELQADAGDYRDVRARVDKLTKAQARG
jgi:tetratricopeptide (TPR) repeat protein